MVEQRRGQPVAQNRAPADQPSSGAFKRKKKALQALSEAAKPESPIGNWILLGPDVVCAVLGVHPRTLRRWTKAGDFPMPVEMPGRLLRWKLRTIDEWIKERAAR